MSTLNDFPESLKLRRVRTSSGQHRIAACQWEKKCLDLFLEPGQQSGICLLERTGRKRCDDTARMKLRANTCSTLVGEDEPIQLLPCAKGAGLLSKDVLGDQELKSTEIGNAEQLRQARPCASDLFAFHVPQRGSWSRLSVTQDVFDILCLQLDVFAAFRDTTLNMGSRSLEVEVAPPPLRWQSLSLLDDIHDAHGWETSYTLRYVEQNGRPDARPWSLRQFTIYNKCELALDSSSWILVAVPDDVMSDFKDVAGHQDLNMLETAVSMHVTFVDTAVAYFRSYLVYLTAEVEEHIRQIKFADPMDECLVDLAGDGTRLKLKTLEDDVSDTVLALEANKEVIGALLRMWRCCGVSTGTEQEEFSIVAILAERTRDIEAFCRRLQSLRDKLTGCTQIVSSFAELSNGQSLQRLAETARVEGKRTMALTKRTQQDAAAVKALTVIALIYLPSTIVLNFFSTSLIDFTDGRPVLAAKWWLFLAIGGPLTVVTVFAWYLWVRAQLVSSNQASEKWWSWRRKRAPDVEKV